MMFNFFRKNKNGAYPDSNNQTRNYPYPYQDYYPNPTPYQTPMSTYDMNVLDTEFAEMRRQINDLHKRMTRIENYLGIREDTSMH